MTGSPRDPGPFHCEAAITFDQSDPAGILFFGNVFPLAHRAFERMLADAGIAWADWFASDTWTIPITRASADFSAPLPAGRTAELEVVVADLRTSAFALSVTFRMDGATCTRVETVHVFVDVATGEKMPIPGAFREALERYRIVDA